MDVTYKIFSDNVVRQDKIKVLKYFPNWMRNTLLSLKKDKFIICPIFNKGDDYFIQVGVTGTLKVGETFDECVNRECGEEIGLISKKNTKFLFLIDYKTKYKNKETKKWEDRFVKTYTIHVNNTRKLKNNIYHEKCRKDDDKSRKIGCFVYGDKKEVLDYISGDIYTYTNDDGILGVGIIKIEEIVKKNHLVYNK